jgi:hypothetical protein
MSLSAPETISPFRRDDCLIGWIEKPLFVDVIPIEAIMPRHLGLMQPASQLLAPAIHEAAVPDNAVISGSQ